MITIKQIAEELGISTTSVSNVIHGKTSEVSEQTITIVKEALKKYNYVPNLSARSLASNKSGLIGVAFLDWADGQKNYLQDAFIGELIGSIERELTAHGYQMLLKFSKSFDELTDTVLSWNIDGLIIFGIQTPEPFDKLEKLNRPIVFIDSCLSNMNFRGVSIQVDDRGAEYTIGKHLIEKGHKRIAFLSAHLKWNESERYMGLAKAMTEAGLYRGKENYIQVVEDGDSIEAASKEAILEAAKEYTAFACFSDYIALMVTNVLQDNGIRVPEDVSVCGFDDNIYGRMCRPRITTIHQSPTEKGIRAVTAIREQIEENNISNEWILMPVSLVEGDSVRDINED